MRPFPSSLFVLFQHLLRCNNNNNFSFCCCLLNRFDLVWVESRSNGLEKGSEYYVFDIDGIAYRLVNGQTQETSEKLGNFSLITWNVLATIWCCTIRAQTPIEHRMNANKYSMSCWPYFDFCRSTSINGCSKHTTGDTRAKREEEWEKIELNKFPCCFLYAMPCYGTCYIRFPFGAISLSSKTFYNSIWFRMDVAVAVSVSFMPFCTATLLRAIFISKFIAFNVLKHNKFPIALASQTKNVSCVSDAFISFDLNKCSLI